jgi:hypothetical protein
MDRATGTVSPNPGSHLCSRPPAKTPLATLTPRPRPTFVKGLHHVERVLVRSACAALAVQPRVLAQPARGRLAGGGAGLAAARAAAARASPREARQPARHAAADARGAAAALGAAAVGAGAQRVHRAAAKAARRGGVCGAAQPAHYPADCPSACACFRATGIAL